MELETFKMVAADGLEEDFGYGERENDWLLGGLVVLGTRIVGVMNREWIGKALRDWP